MLARVTNWSKKAIVITMTALSAIGYVACSEEAGVDGSLNSSEKQVQFAGKRHGNGLLAEAIQFSTPNFGTYSIMSNQEISLAESPVSTGLLALRSFGSNFDSTGLSFFLDYYEQGSSLEKSALAVPSTKRMEIKIYDESSGFSGFVATLFDSQDAFLWEYSFRTDLMIPNRFILEERTAMDELLVETIANDTSFMEVYTQNGITDSFFFATANRDSVRQVHESLLSNNLSRQSGSQIINELNRFDAAYDSATTLVANSDGQLVTEFLTSEVFASAVSANVSDSSGNSFKFISDEICAIAGQCVMLKCAEGFFLNPACDVCAVVFVACIIERIFF